MRSGLNKHKQTWLSHHALKWDTKAPHSRTSWRSEREKHQKLKLAHRRKLAKKWNVKQNKWRAMWPCSRLDASGQSVYPKWSWLSVIRKNYAMTNGNLGLHTQSHLASAWSTRPFGEWQCPEILLLCWQSRQHLCCINPGCYSCSHTNRKRSEARGPAKCLCSYHSHETKQTIISVSKLQYNTWNKINASLSYLCKSLKVKWKNSTLHETLHCRQSNQILKCRSLFAVRAVKAALSISTNQTSAWDHLPVKAVLLYIRHHKTVVKNKLR